MFNPSEIHCWSLIKYKQIKRNGREETNAVQVAVDENNRRIGVFARGEELEQVFYHMEVSRYPVLKFKDNHLYVISNSQGQGFRLSFRSQDKSNFMSVMRRQAYISESPAKNSNSIERVQSWSSCSQPLMPPPAHRAIRNLSQPNFASCSPSPITSFSQPIYDPYTSYSPRPFSSESISSSIGSALSSLSEYTDISFGGVSQCSSQQSSNFISPSTQPPSIPELVDKAVQTDELSQLANNSEFVMSSVKKLIKEEKFQDLVKKMRAQIQKMSGKELDAFFEKMEGRSTDDDDLESMDFMDL